MSEKKEITSKLEIPLEDWDEAVEFLEEHDRSRRTSDKHHAEQILSAGIEKIRESKQREKALMTNYQDLKSELEELVNRYA